MGTKIIGPLTSSPVLLLACVVGTAFPIGAAVLEVDAGGGTAFQSVQPAIDASVPDQDSVFVRCGTYNETISMRSGVSVRGEGRDCTVLDGGQAGSVVSFISVGAGTILEGFTITNGSSGQGGGIFIEGSAPTIAWNTIVGNIAVGSGFPFGAGGGIHITTPISEEVSLTAPVITNNVIRDNVAERWGGGIEVYLDDGSVIAGNLIEHNTAGQGGGGIDAFFAFPTIVGNTIVRNCLQSPEAACVAGGGGIEFTSSGISDVSWNVIAENEAAAGGGGVDVVNSVINFVANDAFSNTPSNYAGVTDPTGSDGNVSVDPVFVDPVGGDWRLQATSPLLDVIPYSADEVLPCRDLDDLPRLMDHDTDGLPERDLGAYERPFALGDVENLRFSSVDTLEWDASAGATSYNVYRDLLSVLGPMNLGTCFDSTSFTSFDDGELPVLDTGFFYLVTVVEAFDEGTLGFQTCTERPNFTPCP